MPPQVDEKGSESLFGERLSDPDHGLLAVADAVKDEDRSLPGPSGGSALGTGFFRLDDPVARHGYRGEDRQDDQRQQEPPSQETAARHRGAARPALYVLPADHASSADYIVPPTALRPRRAMRSRRLRDFGGLCIPGGHAVPADYIPPAGLDAYWFIPLEIEYTMAIRPVRCVLFAGGRMQDPAAEAVAHAYCLGGPWISCRFCRRMLSPRSRVSPGYPAAPPAATCINSDKAAPADNFPRVIHDTLSDKMPAEPSPRRSASRRAKSGTK